MRKKDSNNANENFRQQDSSLKVVEKEVVTEQQQQQTYSLEVLKQTSSSFANNNHKTKKQKFDSTDFENNANDRVEIHNTSEILDFNNEDINANFSLDDFRSDSSTDFENNYYDNSSSPISYNSKSKSYNTRYVAPKSKITNYNPENKLHKNQKSIRQKTFREQQDEHTEKFFKKDDGPKLKVEDF